jgi:hypothetical protein
MPEVSRSDLRPVITPQLALAASMYRDRGVYAVLAGSGMSTAAGIKTGWELTKQLAELEAQKLDGTVPDDIEVWWSANKGVPLDYSNLVEAIAPAIGTRRTLLASIIEPNDDELALGLKLPTAAHRGLADLVVARHVRVILTTNFDRLIEQALSSVGVDAQVLTGPEDLPGMTPVQHTACTVVKLHGDYGQANILNTARELASYQASWSSFVERVLHEYGLVTIGWSGASDDALRRAIVATCGQLYGCFFGVRGDLHAELREMAEAGMATVVPVRTADEFFDELTGALKELDHQPTRPLKTATVIGTTKRLLQQRRTLIELREFLLREARLLKERLDAIADLDPNAYLADVDRVLLLGEPVAVALGVGAYYGTPAEHYIWNDVFRVVADQPMPLNIFGGAWVQELGLRRLPAAMAFQAALLGAWAVEDLDFITLMLGQGIRHAFFEDALAGFNSMATCPAFVALAPPEVLDVNVFGHPTVRCAADLSDKITEAIRVNLEDQYPVRSDFRFASQDIGYLVALLQHDWHIENGVAPHQRWSGGTFQGGSFNTIGAFIDPQPPPAPRRFTERLGALSSSRLLAAGLFGGDPRRLARAQQAVG